MYKFQKIQDPEFIKEKKDKSCKLIKDLSYLAVRITDEDETVDFLNDHIVVLTY